MAESRDVLTVETYKPISELQNNQEYSQIFYIDKVEFNERMIDIEKTPFARITLSDKSGSISGVVWNYRSDMLQSGTFAYMIIHARIYKGNLGFYVNSSDITCLDDEDPYFYKYDYIRGISDSFLDSCANEIQLELEGLEDPDYRNIACNAMHELSLLNEIRNAPYGIAGPMEYRGGLLVHIAHAMRFAKVGNTQARELEILFNPSLVLLGCVLRNIGWSTTIRYDNAFLNVRDAFHMTGIYRASFRYVNHLIITTESNLEISIPEPKKQALENICNEVRDIKTLEGRIVNNADQMADILDFGAAILNKKSNKNWSDELFIGHIACKSKT